MQKPNLDEQIRIIRDGNSITVSRRAFERHYKKAGYKLLENAGETDEINSEAKQSALELTGTPGDLGQIGAAKRRGTGKPDQAKNS